MRKVAIKGTGSCPPARVVPNSYFESIVDTSDQWITTRTGIRQRRMVEPGQSLSDLATPAGRRALDMAGVAAEDLDLIIVGTSTADMPTPSTGCLIQQRLGASRAAAFDVNAACPGFIYSLTVAQKFLQDGSHDLALVVGGEVLSTRVDYRDRRTCVLFGDGAGAVVLGPAEPGQGNIINTKINSNGDLWDLLFIPGGGSLHPPTHEMIDHRLPYVKMQGQEVFKHAVRCMYDSAEAVMSQSGVSARQIDWFIPHQANIRIMEAVAKRLGIAMDKVIITVHKYGNTSAATIPTALDEAVRDGRIQSGDLILASSFGAGFTWGSTLIRF